MEILLRIRSIYGLAKRLESSLPFMIGPIQRRLQGIDSAIVLEIKTLDIPGQCLVAASRTFAVGNISS